MLRLGHHAAFARPAVPGLVAQFLEKAFGFAAFGGFRASLGQLVCDRGFEPWIAGEAENIVNAVVLAPRHQLLAAEA